MGSIKELVEMIALVAVTGLPLFVLCLCRIAKAADEKAQQYQHWRTER
jgi:hypothetical protein